jgi:hypothetical protein
MSKPKTYTINEVIELWAIHRTNGTSGVRLGLDKGAGGPTGLSESGEASRYIESLRTFRRAEAVLVWLYAASRLDNETRGGGQLAKIGNAFRSNAARMEFRETAGYGNFTHYSVEYIAEKVMESFLRELVEAMRHRPFTFCADEPAEDDAPIPKGAVWTARGWRMGPKS